MKKASSEQRKQIEEEREKEFWTKVAEAKLQKERRMIPEINNIRELVLKLISELSITIWHYEETAKLDRVNRKSIYVYLAEICKISDIEIDWIYKNAIKEVRSGESEENYHTNLALAVYWLSRGIAEESNDYAFFNRKSVLYEGIKRAIRALVFIEIEREMTEGEKDE